MEGNFEWFLEHYDEIYSLCGNCNVVIKDKRIIGIFRNEIEALQWINKNNLVGKVDIQYCNGEESGYTNYCL